MQFHNFVNDVVGSGLDVDVVTPSKFGAALDMGFTSSEARFDTTALAQNDDYPMTLSLLADGPDNCYIKQGDSTVVLSGSNYYLIPGERPEVNVSGPDEAYFAHQSVSASGTLTITRKDVKWRPALVK